jgi:hypothetical protein
MRPKETGRHAGNAAARKTDSDGSGNAKRTHDARTFQGISNARRPSQPAPRWRAPVGSNALADLQAAFRKPPGAFNVVGIKSSGKRSILCAGLSQAEAEEWVASHRPFAVAAGGDVVVEAAALKAGEA